MNVLVWNNIWVTQGNFLFSLNCLKNYLAKEANILASLGFSVDMVVPKHLNDCLPPLENSIKLISFDLNDAYLITGDFDPISKLYERGEEYKTDLDPLRKKLAEFYDIIFLWETPVPFLSQLYPDALIIHQMPGVYSRPPAPNLITIDTRGLYKNSTLHNYPRQIKEYQTSKLWNCFIKNRKDFFDTFNFFEEKIEPYLDRGLDVVLLPLQVTNHYNFRADTKYGSQLEFLLDVITRNPDSNIIATQYVTPNILDCVLTETNLNSIKLMHEHFFFDKIFNEINSVSELILPRVDKVISCSSSLALQGVLASKTVEIFGDTYLKPYDNVGGEFPSSSVGSFILDRYNLNFDFIQQHNVFFVNLLEELRAKKNLVGIDSLVTFSDLSEEYAESLDSCAREGRANKNWLNWIKKENLCLNKIKRQIRDPKIETVSFDVFDTLITRPVFSPKNLFQVLSYFVGIETNGRIQNFNQIRQSAESFLRKDNEEVTLDEIYTYIKDHYELTKDLLDYAKQKEISLEIEFSNQAPEGRQAYLEAKKANKRIILTSDTYLPKEVITNILSKNNYSGYDELYISSDIKKTKAANGNLFEYVIQHEKCDAAQIIHIGDKKNYDVENAQARGLKAIRLISSIDRIKGEKILIEAFTPKESLCRSMFLGLYKDNVLNEENRYIYRDSLTQGSPYNFGYAVLGPFVLSYTLWLNRIAKEKGYDCLYFLAREGHLLREAFSIINRETSTKYLLASRRALYGASLQSVADIYTYCNLSFVSQSKLSTLLKSRFGIEEKTFLSKFKDFAIDNNQDGRNQLFDVALCFKDQILSNSEIEYGLYKEYLDESGLIDCEKPAIVDIGWQGRMQSRLQIISGRKFDGLYYATLENALSDINAYGFSGNKITREFNSIVSSNRKHIELFLCGPTKSFVKFEKLSGMRTPIYENEPYYYFRAKMIGCIHAGALDFVRDYNRLYRDLMEPSCRDGESVFEYFLNHKLFYEIPAFEFFCFNDSIAGASSQNLVDLRKTKQKVQKPVKEVQGKANDNLISCSKQEVAINTLSTKRKLERWLIEHLAQKRYKEKYYRDRDAYVRDSKSTILKWLSK